LTISLVTWLAACSNQDESATNADMKSSESDSASSLSESAEEGKAETSAETPVDTQAEPESDRMVIQQAQLQLNVNNLENTQTTLEAKAVQYGGYVVESNVYQNNGEFYSANIIVRVPEAHFQEFLRDAEGEAAEIVERNVTGQDVTEQYVDLESRLRAKRVVEERLLEFMNNATKTDDLLKISTNLATVQGEIEQMVGKMKYLENQISYGTITLSLLEDRVIVPAIDNQDLNTWEKTKKQLATSTNFLLAAVSACIIFFVGNLPILLSLLVAAVIVFWLYKRKKKSNSE
jgi:hypothetical protein